MCDCPDRVLINDVAQEHENFAEIVIINTLIVDFNSGNIL